MKYALLLGVFLILQGSNTLTAQKPAKNYFVSGLVTDAGNNPVSDAVILLNNRSTETKTDQRGIYRIRVKPSDTLISVFIVNTGMSEERLDGRTSINFRLTGHAGGIQQEIAAGPGDQEINIGYGSVKQKHLTTSVSKIDGSNRKYTSYANIYEMIKGEVPGVQVVGNKIIIQGIGSINYGNDPLIILDGIEVASMEDIPPQMVQSIEILKGSSASIYGSRGANGVILITLKKGEIRK